MNKKIVMFLQIKYIRVMSMLQIKHVVYIITHLSDGIY